MLGRFTREAALKHYSRSLNLRARSFSTPSPNTKGSPESENVVPPPTTTKRSPLGLQPKSMKPQTSLSPDTSSAPPAHLKKRKALPAAPQPKPVEEQGITAMIQHDIEHAEKLGILKTPPPGSPGWKIFLFKGWEMTKFYCRGARTTYRQGKDVYAIRRQQRTEGKPILRSQHRLIRTYNADLSRLIPFLIIACITEEIIPVVAIYAPFLLPSTFILPAQQLRIDRKRAEKALTSSSANQTTLADIIRREGIDGKLPDSVLKESNVSAVLCSILRLPTFGFDFIRARRVRNHLRFLAQDDALLRDENLVSTLSNQDLEHALWERGFNTGDLSTSEQQATLQWWLDSVQGIAPEDAQGRRLYILAQKHSE